MGAWIAERLLTQDFLDQKRMLQCRALQRLMAIPRASADNAPLPIKRASFPSPNWIGYSNGLNHEKRMLWMRCAYRTIRMRSFVWFFARTTCGCSGSHRSNANKSTSTAVFRLIQFFFSFFQNLGWNATVALGSGLLFGGSLGDRQFQSGVYCELSVRRGRFGAGRCEQDVYVLQFAFNQPFAWNFGVWSGLSLELSFPTHRPVLETAFLSVEWFHREKTLPWSPCICVFRPKLAFPSKNSSKFGRLN